MGLEDAEMLQSNLCLLFCIVFFMNKLWHAHAHTSNSRRQLENNDRRQLELSSNIIDQAMLYCYKYLHIKLVFQKEIL